MHNHYSGISSVRGAESLWRACCVLSVLLCVFSLSGCAPAKGPAGADVLFVQEDRAAAATVAAGLSPEAQGLSSWQGLETGLAASLAYVSTKNADEVALADNDLAVTWGELAATLTRLRELLPRLDADPGLLASEFRWLRLSGPAHYSGYYEAEILASRVKKAGFEYPLYRTPKDLRTVRLGDFDRSLLGSRLVCRIDSGGDPVPYYSREDIDVDGALRGRSLELAYVADPVDVFFLQVQGSGRLRFEDGRVEHVLYDADNGRAYTAIGQTLAGMGLIDPANVSMQSIRAFLHDNPELLSKILNMNHRYVFFRLADEGPFGSMGHRLTPMVSLAVDRTTFPMGSVALFSTTFPGGQSREDAARGDVLKGIGLAQDTGGAIKQRRVDIFCGSGEKAALTAGHLNARGPMWLLVRK